MSGDDVVERLRHVAWLAEEGSEVVDLATTAADEIVRLRAEVQEKRVDVGELIAQIVRRDDEIVRLRHAGDALAKRLWRGGGDLADMIAAVAAWEEVSRG